MPGDTTEQTEPGPTRGRKGKTPPARETRAKRVPTPLDAKTKAERAAKAAKTIAARKAREAGERQKADAAGAISARARNAVSVEERVREIRNLMLADEWDAKLLPLLAKLWSLSEGHVRHLSAEASRRVRDKDNKALVRAALIDRLDEAVDIAKVELDAKLYPRGSPAKVSESVTKAVLATAQIAGVSTEDKSSPSLTINVGQAVKSAVLDELWGGPELKAIDTHGEPSDERPAVLARELPRHVDEVSAVLDDAER